MIDKASVAWLRGAVCEGCPLSKQMPVPPCPPKTRSDVRVLIVGQNPGKNEVVLRAPFVGRSGEILDLALKEIGVERKTLGLSNVAACATTDNELPPMAAAHACSGRLANEISAYNPHLVIALGAFALRALTGRTGMDKIHGLEMEGKGPYDGVRVLTTYHPAAVLRNPRLYPSFVADLRRAFESAREHAAGTRTVRLGSAGLRDRISIDILETAADIDRVIAATESVPVISYDIETDNLGKWNNALHSIAWSWQPDKEHAAVLLFSPEERDEMRQAGVRGWSPTSVSLASKMERLQFLFRHSHTEVPHNGKFDAAQLRRFGVPARVDADTNILAYLLDERSEGVHGLEFLANQYFASGDYKSILKEGDTPDAKGKEAMESLPREVLAVYNGMDAWYTLGLYGKMRPMVDAEGNLSKAERIILRYLDHLLEMENNGLTLDVDAVSLAEVLQLHEVDNKRGEFERLAFLFGQEIGNRSWVSQQEWVRQQGKVLGFPGFSLNPLSSRSMGLLFHRVFGIIQPDKHGKVSTGKKSLEGLVDTGDGWAAEVSHALLAYRQAYKTLTSYLRKLPKMVGPDGRIRTVYKITTVVTGRLASGDDKNGFPNMQNAAGSLKRVFVAEPGWTFVQGDMSQAEIRCLAHYIEDETLNQMLADGVDTHVATASLMFGIPPEQVTKEMRKRGKTLNFGSVYGEGDFARAKTLGITVEESAALRVRYFRAMPRFAAWKAEVERQALTDGYVEQLSGRKRRFMVLPVTDSWETRQKIEEIKREAVNAKIQGLASEITQMACADLYDIYRGDAEVRFCATVHDSILNEVRPWRVAEVASKMKEVMEASAFKHFGIKVPFVADIEAGPNWKDLVPVEGL